MNLFKKKEPAKCLNCDRDLPDLLYYYCGAHYCYACGHDLAPDIGPVDGRVRAWDCVLFVVVLISLAGIVVWDIAHPAPGSIERRFFLNFVSMVVASALWRWNDTRRRKAREFERFTQWLRKKVLESMPQWALWLVIGLIPSAILLIGFAVSREPHIRAIREAITAQHLQGFFAAIGIMVICFMFCNRARSYPDTSRMELRLCRIGDPQLSLHLVVPKADEKAKDETAGGGDA